MRHKLPKPHIYPLLYTWSSEFERMRKQIIACGIPADEVPTAQQMKAIHAANPELRRQRIWRIINQRRRLYACHWAGWRLECLSKRWGPCGPKWLGGSGV